MMNGIEKIKDTIRGNIKNFKSVEADINKFESYIKKSEYLSASKVLQKIKTLIIKDFPDFEKELTNSEDEVNKQVRQFKMSFGSSLISSCEKNKLSPVEGDIRKGFRIKGIIEVKIDFEKEFVTVSTCSKKSKINSLIIDKIISEIKKTDERLFKREWNPEKFINDLYKAYLIVSKDKTDKEVLLEEVQAQLWLKMQTQNDSFRKSFDKDKIKDYPTDEFSVDLNKLLISKPNNIFLSEGAGGITVFDSNGKFRTFKFLTFKGKEGI